MSKVPQSVHIRANRRRNPAFRATTTREVVNTAAKKKGGRKTHVRVGVDTGAGLVCGSEVVFVALEDLVDDLRGAIVRAIRVAVEQNE